MPAVNLVLQPAAEEDPEPAAPSASGEERETEGSELGGGEESGPKVTN
jgi:hypothetical protein